MNWREIKTFAKYLFFPKVEIEVGVGNYRKPAYLNRLAFLAIALALVIGNLFLIYAAFAAFVVTWNWKKWIAGEWRRDLKIKPLPDQLNSHENGKSESFQV